MVRVIDHTQNDLKCVEGLLNRNQRSGLELKLVYAKQVIRGLILGIGAEDFCFGTKDKTKHVY